MALGTSKHGKIGCRRNYGLAGIIKLEGANQFLRERYIREFNDKFSIPAQEKGAAFRPCQRRGLAFTFSVQTDRVVSKDNTVAIGEHWWQIQKCRWRHSLARENRSTLPNLPRSSNKDLCWISRLISSTHFSDFY